MTIPEKPSSRLQKYRITAQGEKMLKRERKSTDRAAQNKHMILWTIQREEAWEQLNERGYITGAIDYIDPDWLSSYRWMTDQMKERIGHPPCKNKFPIWAWYQWQDLKKKKPDLRSSGHLSRNDKGVRIEFKCHENAVLLSDFELWHFVLNYWYLPESMDEGDKFDAELKRQGLSYFETKPLLSQKYHQRIVKSWDKIFDIDWNEPGLTFTKDKKSIQATVWQLKMDQVQSYKHFKSR